MQPSSSAQTVAFGSDEVSPLTDALLAALAERGYAVTRFGAILDGGNDWPAIGRGVGAAVACGAAAFGIVCCWTGTGVAMAANKVPGARAALCPDGPTAAGARRYNDANVLALSLRGTSVPVGLEILEAFVSSGPSDDPVDRAAIASIEPSGQK